jgi:hypothetical protein
LSTELKLVIIKANITGDEQMNINEKKSFSKVSRRKLVDEVLERLQEKIFSGEYEVGDRLPTEPQLMEELGVGRSTLRESIKILGSTRTRYSYCLTQYNARFI